MTATQKWVLDMAMVSSKVPVNAGDARLKRRILIAAVVLVAIVAAFAVYYYVDRYTTPAGVAKTPDPVQALEQRVRKSPNNADMRVALGEQYLLNRRYTDAIAQASAVLKAYPNKDRAMLVLGVSQALNGQPSQALAPLQKFVAIHAKQPSAGLDASLQAAYYYEGESLVHLGKPAAAIKPLESAVAINPMDADSLYLLGVANAASGRQARAVISYQRAVRLVPDYVEAYRGMASSYTALQKPALAKYATAMAAFAGKDFQGAQAGLQQFLATTRSFAPAYLGLGLIDEQLGDYQGALAALKQAQKLQPGDVAIDSALRRVTSETQQ